MSRRNLPLGAARSPILALGLVTILSFVVVTGVTVALTVPAVAITAQESLPAMLPADTALYLTVDLNPSGSTRDQLGAIGRAYASQSKWAHVWNPFHLAIKARHSQSCVKDTVSKAMDHLSDLGHATAFALIPGPPQLTSRAKKHVSLGSRLSRNFVILAPLDVRMTLVDALTGFSFSMPRRALHYRGISIYRESAPACSPVRRLTPNGIYYAAVDKGYIVLGLQPSTIKAVVNAASGRTLSLAKAHQETALFGKLPSGQVAGFYVNSSVLDRRHGLLSRLHRSRALPMPALTVLKHAGTMAAGVIVHGDELTMTVVRPWSRPQIGSIPSAGGLAMHLSATTSAYFSTRGMKPELLNGFAWLRRLGVFAPSAPTTHSLLRDVNGELDMVQPSQRMGSPQHHPHIFLYWQSRDPQRLIGQSSVVGLVGVHPWNRITPHSIAGKSYGLDAGGAGYVFGKGWAMISRHPFQSVVNLRRQPVDPLSRTVGYPGTAPPTDPYSMVWYVNLVPNRPLLRSLFSRMNWGKHSRMRSSLPLYLGPVQVLSGTVQSDPLGSVSIMTVNAVFRVAPGSPSGY